MHGVGGNCVLQYKKIGGSANVNPLKLGNQTDKTTKNKQIIKAIYKVCSFHIWCGRGYWDINLLLPDLGRFYMKYQIFQQKSAFSKGKRFASQLFFTGMIQLFNRVSLVLTRLLK